MGRPLLKSSKKELMSSCYFALRLGANVQGSPFVTLSVLSNQDGGVERAASPWPTLGIRSCRTFCSDLA